MAFVFAPLLSSVGVGISTALAEAGTGTFVAGVVGGAVVSGLSSKINEAVDDLSNTLLGTETVDDIKKSFNEATETALDLGATWYFQDPNYLAKLNRRAGVESVEGVGSVNTTIDQSPLVPRVENVDTAELADLIVKNVSQIATDYYTNGEVDPVESLKNTIGTDANKTRLTVRLTDFYANKSLPDSEIYKSIANVYNGKNLQYPFIRGKIVDGVKVFYWKDEVGDYFEMKQNLGFVLPSIYGVFGGPYSINNQFPEDLADSFFCMHDQSALKGILGNVRGDYQLVSRLSQNKDRLNQESMAFFNSTIAYFSIMASTWLKLKGSLSDDILVKPSEVIITDDFYGSMNTVQAVKNPEMFKQDQFEFYSKFSKDFSEATKTSSMFAQGSKFRTEQIKKDFGDLMVQLL